MDIEQVRECALALPGAFEFSLREISPCGRCLGGQGRGEDIPDVRFGRSPAAGGPQGGRAGTLPNAAVPGGGKGICQRVVRCPFGRRCPGAGTPQLDRRFVPEGAPGFAPAVAGKIRPGREGVGVKNFLFFPSRDRQKVCAGRKNPYLCNRFQAKGKYLLPV